MQKANTEVVQMMFGTNDSMVSVGENPDVSPADFKANMENIIASLKTAGFKKIILNTPPYQIVPNG
jgi:lysophospholipase L1-like esterase